MKIVTRVSPQGKLLFDVVSLEDPDTVEVTTPKGNKIGNGWCYMTQTDVFSNRPSSSESKIIKKFFGRSEKGDVQLNLTCDFIHFLHYSTDDRDPNPIQFDHYPIWKCVKWQVLPNGDARVWNFVKSEMIKMHIQMPEWIGSKRELYTERNLKPLLKIEQDLTTAIILADGGLQTSKNDETKSNKAPKVEGAPSAPPPAYNEGSGEYVTNVVNVTPIPAPPLTVAK